MRIRSAHLGVTAKGTFRLVEGAALLFISIQLLGLFVLDTIFCGRAVAQRGAGSPLLWLGLLSVLPRIMSTCMCSLMSRLTLVQKTDKNYFTRKPKLQRKSDSEAFLFKSYATWKKI